MNGYWPVSGPVPSPDETPAIALKSIVDTTSRRTFLKLMGATATGCLAAEFSGHWLRNARAETLDTLYDLPMKGHVRLLHTTDIHAQLLPVYFREPNVNLGLGEAEGKLPHRVGRALLDSAGIREGSIEAYAFTCLDFEESARRYGKMGGAANLASLYRSLREQAGADRTLTLDGGDLWQGSATSLWTRGRDMVEVSNLLGVDVMTGHWEFTYNADETLSNIQAFNGEFVAQNVRIKEDSLFEDAYFEMAERHDGLGLYDEDNAIPFRPYVVRDIAGHRVAVVGQAFPRTANANPQGFIPDWTFGIREDELIELVGRVRDEEAPDAVILLSHNGMDVDLKLASRVDGIDAILGGHTHDGIPVPVEVATPNGGSCLVTNAGTNGKFAGVLDIAFADGQVAGMAYHLLPVFDALLEGDPGMAELVSEIRSRSYDESVVECRAPDYRVHPGRLGRRYDEILSEKLAIADRTLYRRGNFMGTWDQLICDALKHEYGCQIALSPGFRWGTSVLEGEWITMEDVMTQTAMTYGETYVQEMTGETLMTILESVADNLFDPDPYLQAGGDMARVSGMHYSIDPSRPLLERITEAVLDSGERIEADGVYAVAGWGVVGDYPEGRLIWDIVRDYLVSQRGEDNVIRIPRMYHPTLIGVSGNPGITDYEGVLA
ncbi:MAG: thiosulfohydrolase SoxB [Gammaproteobacteria bacterium]|nr:thiosulfohydrolase SoxB [Gammaproteobacteria bacterium]MYJ52670.1 thiosulfohydrolase SoxB [Gammaproteobacteria bacterium]